MEINDSIALCYDDVLLKPRYSEVLPSNVSLKTRFSKNIKLELPIVSSAMDTVTDGKMALKMSQLGGIGIIHKNYVPKDQLKEIEIVKAEGGVVGAAVGVGDKERARAKLLAKYVDVFVIDTAHGHSKGVLEMLQEVRALEGKFDVVAGNVATPEACEDLIQNGADGVKIGIGPGSICTTRVVAGVGVPQLQALIDCAEILNSSDIPFVADGGIRHSGDIVKALAVGASCVMLGSILAGCEEAASERVHYQGRSFKRYRGMGSLTAMGEGSKDRYGQGNIDDKKKLVPEGVEGLVPYKGLLEDTLYQIVGGVRSGMGYLGASSLEELEENAHFIRISSNTVKENHPHDIVIDIGAPNY